MNNDRIPPTSPTYMSVSTPSIRIRVIVVGMGGRGRYWAGQLRDNPAYLVVGCVEVDEERRQRASLEAGIPPQQCFADLETALDESEAQAVVVATPAEDHQPSCELALSKGAGVLVEKPFTVSLREALQLVESAESKGLPLIVAQNYRYMRSFRTARRLIAEGVLGRIGIVVCQYYRVPHEMTLSLSRVQHSMLWGAGVHHLDALRYVLGKNVTRVMAESFTLPWGQLPPGASMRVMLSMEDDARVSYSGTYESSGHEFFERGQEFYIRFVGERATLHVFQRWLILCERHKLPRLIRRGARTVTEEQVLLGQFERSLLVGEEPNASGRDNLQTMAVVEACVRSSNEQRWINPQELLNEHQ
ncbi:MAG: Gfo/Idh/MocA family oxidoreductase [Pyrinomonadaceae bacterium]|nr:Gfo/Idh/MocA family oxidoreductase [Pyrinomonadaceae bacterium]